MSSINQSWNPPMAAQDEMVDILTENILGVTTRTFGGISISGCLKMNDEYGTAGDEMTNTWHIFGDPTMMVRTAQPLDLQVNHATSTNLGAVVFPVNVNIENALVAISQNGILLGKANVAGSAAIVNFEAISSLDSLTVTVTAFNRIPYQGKRHVDYSTDEYPQSGRCIAEWSGSRPLQSQTTQNRTIGRHEAIRPKGSKGGLGRENNSQQYFQIYHR